MRLRRWKYLLLSLPVTVVAMLLSVISAEAGHGSYMFAKLCYPWPMLLSLLTENVLRAPSIALAILQLPLYGCCLDVVSEKNRLKWVAPTVILAHTIGIVACYRLLENF